MKTKYLAVYIIAIQLGILLLSPVKSQSFDRDQNLPNKDKNDIRRPNIVFILADDLGYSDINSFSPLGNADYYETPNIDRLTKQGMKFTNAYTNAPNCTPTRAALISGQYYPELTDAKIPGDHVLDGINLLPLLRNPEVQLEREALYWHFPGYLDTRAPNSWRTTPVGAIRFGDWKLLQFFEDNLIELYNLDDDIGEHHDLSKEYPDKVKELLGKIEGWREKMNAPIPKPKD